MMRMGLEVPSLDRLSVGPSCQALIVNGTLISAPGLRGSAALRASLEMEITESWFLPDKEMWASSTGTVPALVSLKEILRTSPSYSMAALPPPTTWQMRRGSGGTAVMGGGATSLTLPKPQLRKGSEMTRPCAAPWSKLSTSRKMCSVTTPKQWTKQPGMEMGPTRVGIPVNGTTLAELGGSRTLTGKASRFPEWAER